jgi:dTDP-4-amino-4,6-dideoxygalactose transaminase
VGAKYQNLPIGNCKYSDITVFSFHPVKIITTAEGGAALTNSAGLASKMNLFRSHGITKDENYFQQNSDGPWYYEQITLGFNYRMTELQAALGISQLKRVNGFIDCRHRLAKRYDELLKDLPLTTPFQMEDGYSAFHLYVICLDNQLIDKTHLQVFEALRSFDIGVNLHYIPIYRHPYYRDMGFNPTQFPSAEKYYQEAISLPMFSSMIFEEQEQVVDSLERALGL